VRIAEILRHNHFDDDEKLSQALDYYLNRKAWDTKHLLRGLWIGMKKTENFSRVILISTLTI